MSSLDTPVYHDYLRKVAPPGRDALIVDVGGGDGRNALPWLEWGYRRIVVVDPAPAALERFRARVAAQNAAWLENLLLIEGDARALPLANECVDRVLAIESLYYLNEDYEQALRECRRIMRRGALLLLSDRDYEGGLLTRLLYDGVEAFVNMAETREVWDGIEDRRVRTRCFTQQEIVAAVEGQGLHVRQTAGISVFSLILAHLSSIGRLDANADARREEVLQSLFDLAHKGTARRCHVLIIERGTAI